MNSQPGDTIEELRGVAKAADMSLDTLAIRWVLSNKAITAPIIGASWPEQLADSLAAGEKVCFPTTSRPNLTK